MKFKRETNLQSMCLHVIVDNIHIFSIPSKSIEFYVEFLRRLYSDKLFELIGRKCLVPEKYFEWLLSPHWKNVSLPGSGYSVSGIISKLRVMGEAINSLNLHNSSCSADILSATICCVPNVTYLNLGWTVCTDDIVTLIRKMCPSLISLNLSNCRNVSDIGMKNLCSVNSKLIGFNSLKELNISRTCVTSKSIIFILKHLTSLQTLSYVNLFYILYNSHKSDMCNLDGRNVKYNLTNFEYHPSGISLKQVLEILTFVCPYITQIYIEDKTSERDFQLLSNFKCLTKLAIVNIVNLHSKITISSFLTISGAMITQLELFHLALSAEVITKACHNLKYLFLCKVDFEDFNSSLINTELHKLNSLEALIVKHVNFKKDHVSKSIHLLISSSKHLNELCIQYAEHFTHNLADVILKLPDLTIVDFSFTDIKPRTLLNFFTSERITKIRADGCPHISIGENESDIGALLNDSQHGNTYSWELDYSELVKEPSWHCFAWSGDNPFENQILSLFM